MDEYIVKKYHFGKEYNSEFINNTPFENIVFNNFFNSYLLNEIIKEFPDLKNLPENKNIKANLFEKKFATNNELNFGINTSKFIHFLNSQIFLNWLSDVTGIENLIPDPYLFGGGLHEIKKGGFLKLHADFNNHPKLKLERKLNILIYLNHNWKEKYGGGIEFWDKDVKKCVKRESPDFNKLVIFKTTDTSWHGHPDPLDCPENTSRKSIALYYYTYPKIEINYNKYHNTLFKLRKREKKTLLFASLKKFFYLILPPLFFILINKIRKL